MQGEESYQKVRILYFGTIRNVVARRDEEIEMPTRSSVRHLLRALIKKYGERFEEAVTTVDGGLRDGVVLLLSGKNIEHLSGLDTVIEGGSEARLVVTTALGGG